MPQVGERKTQGGVTGEWDGTTWRQVGNDAPQEDPAQAPQGSSLGRFLGGAMEHTPFNPMNLVNAISHPIDTIGGLVKTGMVDPITELVEAGKSGYQALTGTGDPKVGSPRGGPAVDALRHLEGAIPFVGKSLQGGSDKIAGGDVAGGLGSIAGDLSSAFLPEAMDAAPAVGRGAGRVTSTVGRGVEGVGNSTALTGLGGLGGVMEIATGHPLAGIATMIAPPLAKGAGRGLQAAGDALTRISTPEAPPIAPQSTSTGGPIPSIAAREQTNIRPQTLLADAPPQMPSPAPMSNTPLTPPLAALNTPTWGNMTAQDLGGQPPLAQLPPELVAAQQAFEQATQEAAGYKKAGYSPSMIEKLTGQRAALQALQALSSSKGRP